MLSLREDLLPPEWTEELAQLRSSAAPVPFDEILPVIEHALGDSPSKVFVDSQRSLRFRIDRAGAPSPPARRAGSVQRSARDRDQDRNRCALHWYLAQFVESDPRRAATGRRAWSSFAAR
jgi:hypothetical protein